MASISATGTPLAKLDITNAIALPLERRQFVVALPSGQRPPSPRCPNGRLAPLGTGAKAVARLLADRESVRTGISFVVRLVDSAKRTWVVI